LWAQFRVKSTYALAQQVPSQLSGAAAARYVLDSAGLTGVGIEQSHGFLSDHYDPRDKVLRLSPEVYQSRSMAAVGIAAHEAGHAIQDARNYAPLVVRNLAVPMAGIGSTAGLPLLFFGLALSAAPIGSYLFFAGVALFGATVAFQLVNLPVEFDASRRAKLQLVDLGIVPASEMGYVNKVLSAAALTYVAATLQAVLTLLYYVLHFMAASQRRD
jgi:Zn-dependent membrane protease YugP